VAGIECGESSEWWVGNRELRGKRGTKRDFIAQNACDGAAVLDCVGRHHRRSDDEGKRVGPLRSE
jgi:hypothetical protein